MLIVGVSALVVVAVGVVGIMWWSTRSGTPDLPPDLEALRPEAVSVAQMRPTQVGDGWRMAVSQVETSNAYVQVWPEDESQPGDGAVVEVGTSAVIGSCTVALLETHPGRSLGAPGSQDGEVLIHVACEPLPAAAPSGSADTDEG